MAEPTRKSQKLAERVGAVYTRRDIAGWLGVGVSTLKSHEAAGRVPGPDLRLSARCVRYSEKTAREIYRRLMKKS